MFNLVYPVQCIQGLSLVTAKGAHDSITEEHFVLIFVVTFPLTGSGSASISASHRGDLPGGGMIAQQGCCNVVAALS